MNLKEGAGAGKWAHFALCPFFLSDLWNTDLMANAPAVILGHEANL